MGLRAGQDSGQSVGFDWRDYVGWLVDTHGSLAAAALKLSLARGGAEDARSVERALRRLRSKEVGDAGAWGARLLRVFGVPREIEARVRWMGLYHSRFSDLPVAVCLDLLRAWDRPPVNESVAGAFVALGLAHCALRNNEWAGAEPFLSRARTLGAKSVAARCEERLATAYLTARRGGKREALQVLESVRGSIDKIDIGADGACFDARAKDQIAYLVLRRPRPDFDRARSLYESIRPSGPRFALCKRDLGLAYIAHETGDGPSALGLARSAVSHAGDAGLVRQRAIALGLLARIASGSEAASSAERALALATDLEDEDLLARIRGSDPPTRNRRGDSGR